MPLLTGPIVYGVDAFSYTVDPLHALGQLGQTKDGRKVRYVKAGATALVVGNALQAPVEDVDHDNVAVRVTAINATELLITTGASGGALDANEYQDGWAVIDTTPGLGYMYKIHSHLAIAASTDGILTLYPEDKIQVALTASSKVTLVKNPYKDVIQHPVTTATNVCLGGVIAPITAAYYGWIQTGGAGAALIAGTPAAGQPLTSTGAVAGALTVHSAELNSPACMMVTGRDGKVLPVFWNID